ncbi:phosphotransferase [Candidatus Poribacteria bacterium]
MQGPKTEYRDQKEVVARYLSWALGADAEVLTISALPGCIHQNLRVHARLGMESRSFVLRRMPLQKTLGFARGVVPYNLEAEFTALKDLEGVDLLTPKVWGLDREGRFLDMPAFLMEYIEGPTVLDAVESNPEVIAYRFAETILAMNRVSADQLPDLVGLIGESDEDPADLLGWLTAQAGKMDAPSFFLSGLDLLTRELPSDRPKRVFGNGDLGPQNFIYTADGSIAVVDWEYAGFNDPIAEIMLLHVWPEDDPFLRKHPIDKLYCRLAGIDVGILRWYEIYGALSGWLFAAGDCNRKAMMIYEQKARNLFS